MDGEGEGGQRFVNQVDLHKEKRYLVNYYYYKNNNCEMSSLFENKFKYNNNNNKYMSRTLTPSVSTQPEAKKKKTIRKKDKRKILSKFKRTEILSFFFYAD